MALEIAENEYKSISLSMYLLAAITKTRTRSPSVGFSGRLFSRKNDLDISLGSSLFKVRRLRVINTRFLYFIL